MVVVQWCTTFGGMVNFEQETIRKRWLSNWNIHSILPADICD